MICKHCGAELQNEEQLCPVCGKSQTEEKTEEVPQPEAAVPEGEESPAEEATQEEALLNEVLSQEEAQEETPEKSTMKPGAKPWQIVTLTLVCVALLAGLAFMIIRAVNEAQKPSQETNPPEATLESQPSTLGTSVRGNYAVTDEEAAAMTDQVVARVGDLELTNAELQIFYWMGVYDFLENNSAYLTYYGLDLTKPLGEQVQNPQTGDTWEQSLLEYALQTWHRYAALYQKGMAEGFTLSEDTQKMLDSLAESMEELAKENDYETAQELIAADMGAGANMEGYEAYQLINCYALEYFQKLYEGLNPTDEEIEAYFAENEDTFAESDITKESGYTVDVRHILVIPEGGTKSEDGKTTTYSQEEWDACQAEAQKILDQWLAGEATEDTFAQLAGEYSEDPGSKSKGGLYTGVTQGYMVEEFNDWIFDEARKPGDYGLVKTSIGYHIMYFSGSQEIWYTQAKKALLSQMSTDLIEGMLEAYPMEVDYQAIGLGYVKLSSDEE